MRKTSLLVLSILTAASLLLSACGSAATEEPAASASQASASDNLSGTITVSGAFALYPMMTVWADEFTKLHPNVQFDVQGGGAGKGMTDTLAGAVDIGMISRSIKPEEEAKGAFWVPVAKDAVFPLVSESNPALADLKAKGISQDMFKKIFITGEVKTWGDVVGKPEVKDEIHVYTRSDSAGAADQWSLYSGGKVQADIQGIGVNGEPALVDTVAKDPDGIGFSNLNSVFDITSGKLVSGVVVPPIDINGNGKADPNEYYQTKDEAVKVIADGTYPSPPARFENLATKGKPAGLTLAFIQWILNDGQKLLNQAGYVPLTADQQAEALAKLK
ncbi:MAG TPA: substrate-binding domain-containing protein [Anaerolineales bacterium]|nr:substrate-binding domain-containing protein [Anaerolineales bacterium]